MVAVELSKVVVVTINVIFLIFGLAALIVGIVFKVGWDEVRDAFDLPNDVELQSAGDILGYAGIIFGAFIIIVSLLGCVGACCKLRILLVLYAIILILLIIAECAVVGVVATHADKTKDVVGKALEENLKNYYENSTDDKSRGYSAIFKGLECCGIFRYNDSFPVSQSGQPGFIPAPQRNGKDYGVVVPITCCKDFDYEAKLTEEDFKKHESCTKHHDEKTTYTKGCIDSLYDKIKDNKAILIGVGVTILVLELLMVIIAFFLCCRYDSD